MLNKVMLIGRLGKNPELKYTQGGSPVCSFSIATDENWKDAAGEKQQRTTWHAIVAWNKLAEICGQYLEKGKLIYVEGKIQIREWEDKEGGKRKTTEIVINNMTMLSSPNANSGSEKKKPVTNQPETTSNETTQDDDDIPF